MAAFKGKKPATKEARKILLSQIRKALQPVEGSASDAHIHKARKQIKKARATLRLLRKSLPPSQYRAENECLRNASAPLSEARDACVLLQTFDHLNAQTRAHDAAALRRQLFEERSRARANIAGPYGLPRARRLLRKAQTQASHWQMDGRGWSVLGPGIKKIYAQGRGALALARRSPSDTNLHEWRKQSKYLRHQLELMRPVWPGLLEPLAEEVHELSNYLGDDHDLAVLRSKAAAQGHLSAESRAQILALIDAHRRPLQVKALQLGARLYADSPGRFCKRLGRYWHVWRKPEGS